MAKLRQRDDNGRFVKASTPEVKSPSRQITLDAPFPVVVRRRPIAAKFDAAQTTTDNTRHWTNADALSANAAMKLTIRRTIIQRSRYEVANNSFAKGIVETLADDVVGSGPRLQMLTADQRLNKDVEREFALWCRRTDFGKKVRLMRRMKAQDGEVFALLYTRKSLRHPVKLDFRLLEPDQVTTPAVDARPTNKIDGIKFDDDGQPIEYHVLKRHPGRITGKTYLPYYDKVKAEAVIHYFTGDRAGQTRGLPDIMPALTLFADLRRYSQAVIAAAESAADFAAVMYTEQPAGDEAADMKPLESVEIEKRTMLAMPGGWKMSQLKAEQPTGSYKEFVGAKINEIARCLSMPFNVAMGNSGGYNYASGRLDFQTYDKKIDVERSRIALDVLDRLLEAWLAEAILISDFLPLTARRIRPDEHAWFWPGREHVDPAKAAKGQETRLKNMTTNLAIECAAAGHGDWEGVVEQRIKEEAKLIELRKKYNVPDPAASFVGSLEDEAAAKE